MKLVKNAAGRLVPDKINGQQQIPFKGVGKYKSVNKIYDILDDYALFQRGFTGPQ